MYLFQVYLNWQEYEMASPQDCESTFVELYDPTTAVSDKRRQYCGSKTKSIMSGSNHMYLRLFTTSIKRIPKFKALFTIFTRGM